MLEVTDDSGFLAIVDPDSYVSFVDEDWSLEQLAAHFRDEMSRRRLLIWGTGHGNVWEVDVQREARGPGGFREVSGSITSTEGRLLVTNYESLTMAAECEDLALPEAHQLDQLVTLPRGEYRCRVIQLRSPDDLSDETEAREGFRIELTGSEAPLPPWKEIPWSDI